MKIIKSIGAVVGGFLTVAIMSVLTDWILESYGVFPKPTVEGLFDNKLLVFAFLYRSLYTILGGWVTAKLAPFKPRKHVIALMVLGGISGVLGAIAGWGMSNHWYPIALAVTGPVFVWVGGQCNFKRK
jgi:hypothetical protein